MRYSADHKERSRERILDAASRLLRTRGIEGVGLAAIMKQAGLTHGGFYAHFPSREVLVEEALILALDHTIERLRDLTEAAPPGKRLRTLIGVYLSLAHCRKPEDGCVFAALGSDLARLPPVTRARLRGRYDRLAALIAEAARDDGRPTTDGTPILATMIGTLTLARLAEDDTAAEAILKDGITRSLA